MSGRRLMMAKAFAHVGLTGMKRRDNEVWELASAKRHVIHPDLGPCWVGSFVAGVGAFDVHFPDDAVRICTGVEVAKYTTGKFTSTFRPSFTYTEADFKRDLCFPFFGEDARKAVGIKPKVVAPPPIDPAEFGAQADRVRKATERLEQARADSKKADEELIEADKDWMKEWSEFHRYTEKAGGLRYESRPDADKVKCPEAELKFGDRR